jgi:hypothetical protein
MVAPWNGSGTDSELRTPCAGGALGVVRPALFAPHVVDEEHLRGPAGVHAGSIPALVLQLVSV